MKTQIIHVRPVRTFEDCKTYAAERCAVVKNHVRAELTELQMLQPVGDLSYSPYLCDHENPYDIIHNIISQFSGVALAGWHHFFEAERLRRELAELKGRPVEVAECSVIES